MADKKTINVTSTCSISIGDIFGALHEKAVKAVTECRIQNSALDNNEFQGAGDHIIAALPLKDNTIERSLAIKCLDAYVKMFSGPDAKVDENTVWPLEDEETKKNESLRQIPSFSQFLTEEGEDVDSAKKQHDNNEKDKLSKVDKQDKYDKLSGKSKLEVDKRKDTRESSSAKGFYITYKIEIEGQKEHPLADALKSFGKELLRGIGISSFDWKAGTRGETVTIGDIADSLDKVFGKIDPDELKSRFTKNIQAKYKQSKATDIRYFDQKTLLHYLKDRLDTKAIQKIKSADYSLTYKVDANDVSKKLINTTFVADCITRSIKGIFKKFKNSVKKEDVILVNDYDKEEEKVPSKPKNTVAVDTPQKNESIEHKQIEMPKLESVLQSLFHVNKKLNETKFSYKKFGKYIFEDVDNILNDLLSEEDAKNEKQELISKIISKLDDTKLYTRLQNYSDDLTGSTNDNKITFKPKGGKETELTNKVVKNRIKDGRFGLKLCKLPTLKRIEAVITELENTKPDNSDMRDNIVQNYTTYYTAYTNADDKVKEQLKKDQAYKKLYVELKKYPNLKDILTTDSKDILKTALDKIENRDQLIELDNMFDDINAKITEISDNTKKTAEDKAKTDEASKKENIKKLTDEIELNDLPKCDGFDKLETKTADELNELVSKIDSIKQIKTLVDQTKIPKPKDYGQNLWTKSLDELKSIIGNTSKIKMNHNHIDYYIVPMKNLKLGQTTDDDDSKEVEGKGSK